MSWLRKMFQQHWRLGLLALASATVGYSISSLKCHFSIVDIRAQRNENAMRVSDINLDKSGGLRIRKDDLVRAVASGAALICLTESDPWLPYLMSDLHSALADEDPERADWHRTVALGYAVQGAGRPGPTQDRCADQVRTLLSSAASKEMFRKFQR